MAALGYHSRLDGPGAAPPPRNTSHHSWNVKLNARTSNSPDIAVLGAGPAGALCARLLARLGYAVALVGAPRRFESIEGVAERAAAALEAHGCESALAALGPEVRREASWAGATASANRERVVDRARLDTALSEDAARAGARVLRARAGRLERRDSVWRIPTRSPAGFATVEAAFVVEARGRVSPPHGARREQGPASTALARSWRLPAGARPRTALAAFASGWAWFAACEDGRGVLQIIVSSAKGELPGRAGLADLYRERVAEIAEARDWLRAAAPRGPVLARAASPCMVAPAPDGPMLRIGDAAMAIDPLSGHGMFEALGSALAAAPVINTLLGRPASAETARRYFSERTRQAFLRHARVGRAFYERERRWADAAYWRARARWPDLEPAHPPAGNGQERIELRPVVRENFVVEERVFVTPDHPRGVWQVSGVPLVALYGLLNGPQVSLEQAAAALRRPVADVATAREWLRYRGLVGSAPDG